MQNSTRSLVSGGRVFTGDPENPWAEAVVVDGSRIAFVGAGAGADEAAGPDARRIDARGGLVLPGFIDGHAHLVMTGAALLKAQLRDAPDLEEIQRRVGEWASAHPDAPRVLGTGWVHSTIAGGHPTRQMLDAVVPDRPVYIDAYDFHSCWVNSAALEELGIDRDSPDPVGGRIVRHPSTGEATGHLLETVITEKVWPLLGRVADEEIDQHLAAALESYARCGVTSAVEMALEESALRALLRAQAAGRLSVRVVAHAIIHRGEDPEAELAQVDAATRLARAHRGDHLRVAGIKLISDGTVDGCTAALLEPYAQGGNADPIWDRDSLTRVVIAADAAGLQIAIHAIGDRAIRNAVDALEQAGKVNGTSGLRHRIEHLEYAAPEDIGRLGALGITASMQPVHVDPSFLVNWTAMLGEERAQEGFAWPRYLETGATLAFGTDTPTAPHEPLPNMYVAATRKSPSDASIPAHRPDWALPLNDALLHGTRESARAAWLEHVTGTLRAGFAADLVVLDCDPTAQGPETLLKAEVRLTMMDGRITHAS
jgi:predicted amidohydrolase YtcJ